METTTTQGEISNGREMMTNAEYRKRRGEAGKVRAVDELMAASLNLDSRSDPGVAEISITGDVRRRLSKFDLAGIDVSPAGAAAKIRAELETRHDEQLAADLLTFERDMHATEAALEGRIAASRQPPKTENDLRELLIYRRFEGRSLADVARSYGMTADADDPVFVRMVETDTGDLGRALRLRPEPPDGNALQTLQAAIAARQDARQDRTAAQHLATLREWRTRSWRYAHLLDRARKGDKIEVARLRRSQG